MELQKELNTLSTKIKNPETVLNKYINRASDLAKGLEITDVKERKNLLQDTAVYSNEEQTVDDFLLG